MSSDSTSVTFLSYPRNAKQCEVSILHTRIDDVLNRFDSGTYYNISDRENNHEKWTNEQKSGLIDSVMNGLFIPSVIILEVEKKLSSRKRSNFTIPSINVVDGVERLTALSDFRKNRIPWIYEPQLYFKKQEVQNKIYKIYYSEIPENIKGSSDDKEYIVTVLSDQDTEFFNSSLITITAGRLSGKKQQIQYQKVQNIYKKN
jgi:hypothetical protein